MNEKNESVTQAGNVCPLCGAEEPLSWFEEPMNENIRAYARSYIAPVKLQFPSLYEAAKDWGTHEGLTE